MMKLALLGIGLLNAAFAAPLAFSDDDVSTEMALYAGVNFTSDYRLHGISVSDANPARQAWVHWVGPHWYYLGVWVSDVNFDDPHHTSAEVDAYVGRRLVRGRTEVSVEGLFSSFDDHEAGPTYDFFQAKLRAAHTVNKVTFGSTMAWSPEGAHGSGSVWRAQGELSVQLAKTVNVSGVFGRGMLENRLDRTYWDAGVTGRWRNFSIDVRYVDTNLGFAQCGYVNWCQSAVVTTISLRGGRRFAHE